MNQLHSGQKRDYGANADTCKPGSGFPCGDIYTPVLLSVLLSCIALGHILTYSFCRLTLWPLISRGRQVHWRRIIIVGAVLGQVLQTGFDLSRVIKIYALHFGDRQYWLAPRWEDAAAFAVGALLQSQTQGCFMERAFVYSVMLRVSKLIKWVATVIVLLFIFVSLAMGLTAAVLIKRTDSLQHLSPGDPTARLYGVALIVWALSSAIVDVFLCTVMTTELLVGRRRIGNSSKRHRLLVAFRQMAIVMVESGIVLALVQVISVIAWLSIAAKKERDPASTWIYLPLLFLSRVYTITFLRFSATTLPSATNDNPGSIRSNHVETVEYDWGKTRLEGSSSRGEGVRTVTGLPLEVLGESAPPSRLDEEGGLALDNSLTLRHKTSSGSKMSLSRKPSLTTVDERRRPIASTSYSTSPGATLLRADDQAFNSPSRTYISPHHTPRILDSSSTSSFPFAFASSGEGDRGSPVARGRRMGRRSHETLSCPRSKAASENRFDIIRGGSLDISSPTPSDHTLLASSRFSPPVSSSRPGHPQERMESLERIAAGEAVPPESRPRSRLVRSSSNYGGVGTSSW